MKPNSQMTMGEFFRQCVGIDISKDKFTACLYMYDRASDEGCCTKSINFANTKSGFNQMVRWSRKEAIKGYSLTYLMEPTGILNCNNLCLNTNDSKHSSISLLFIKIPVNPSST